MHYSDEDQPPRARRSGGDGDDDLVGPRRGGAPRPLAGDDEGDLVGPRRGARRSILDDDDQGGDAPRIAAPRLRRGGREGGGREGGERNGLSRETLMGVVRNLPAFVKLLARLVRDPRVSKVDKAVVGAVLVYVVSPVDFIPDWVVPVAGQLDDAYLLALALSRLVNNAGVEVLMDHWDGEMSSLETVLGLLDRAGSVLPAPVRNLLGARR